MSITAYFASLSLLKLVKNLPGGVAQGLIWGLMALGVYITFRLLDVADLTVDGSFTTGGAVTVMLILAGVPAWAALLKHPVFQSATDGLKHLLVTFGDQLVEAADKKQVDLAKRRARCSSAHCAVLLVLRHRAGLRPPRYRQQP